MNQSTDPKREIFEQSYFDFFKVLELLSKNAEEQCDIMGWYNVAWELRDDIRTGWCLLKTSDQYLLSSQKNAISNFLKEIENLPDEIFCETNTRKGNLDSMNNQIWDSIRLKAKELIEILKPVTAANKVFYGKN